MNQGGIILNEQPIITKLAQAIARPNWFDGKRIDEADFCRDFLTEYPMVCVHGSFFSVDGRIFDEDRLKRDIYDWINPYMTSGLPKMVDNLLELLRVEAYSEDLPALEDRVHVANGTYILGRGFVEEKEYCRNRLPVAFDRMAKDAAVWRSFLKELLEPMDIDTLQEFMGYCLIPSTRAQKMLMLVGSGGEGKSRIGVVMRALFGDNMANGNLSKIETNRFARADLEHMLVMVDDDMKLEALPQTNYIKTIITAEQPLDLEKKNQQSYQAELYCRFLAFGNGGLKSLYDHSHGFYRRQIILTTKKRPADRIDDPHLSDKLIAEKNSIFLWCLDGLLRLVANNFRFTISQRSRENIENAISESNNIVEFLHSEGYIAFRADDEISSKQLYTIYELWCSDNALKPMSARTFSTFIMENLDNYGLEATNNIRLSGGKRVRGFVGIRPLQPVFFP